MTYVEPSMAVPTRMAFEAEELEAGASHGIPLPIPGQGTIGFAIKELKPFSVTIRSDEWGAPVFRWRIDRNGAALAEYVMGEWEERTFPRPGDGLDPAENCIYWFSVDFENRKLLFGKGEMRLGTMLAFFDLPPKPAEGDDPCSWLRKVNRVEVDTQIAGEADIWRDPVVTEPPMYVIPHDQITMDDIVGGQVTVPANLTQRCQQLYDAVAGRSFALEDSPEFPFAEAIKASILNKAGWCYKTLDRKAREFGKYDPDATYLRITLGRNQGESPGIPYVMEIWPSGHYSPIHDHGGADAVIKVLHGEIKVDLYPFLSPAHRVPFTYARFRKGDVTWISARLNQVHKLENDNPDEPCITIQCYLYDETDPVHWPYFDYLKDGSEIGLFDPNSDASYEEFKRIMKEEWANPPKPEPAPPAPPSGA